MNQRNAIQTALRHLKMHQTSGDDNRLAAAIVTLEDASGSEDTEASLVFSKRGGIKGKKQRRGMTPRYRKTFRNRLKTAIAKSNMSLTIIAEKADMSDGQIYNYVRGKTKPAIQSLERLSKTLNVKPSIFAHV